eukprot:CAMPEP_0194346772 /NCGR_PEP_ID=MMETSP0171-20130528/105611_1 /TAXON_ID=218684 /ORGANISM="Corethron pennatum, Strain L29A3" /LENGTH=157 /DNA_ID=CAMNT_0039113937 /DNA_START=205 /DNA_END=678 /DNA_ORIENTATION=+
MRDHNIVNLKNVHELTTYDLRQELMLRGHFLEGGHEHITYDALLKKMVELLARKEGERPAALVVASGNGMTLREKLEKEKLDRKAAAVLRSQQRQARQGYFEGKRTGLIEDRHQESEANDEVDGCETQNTRDACEVDDLPSNPFRRNFRLKIGGKCA